MRIGFGVNFMPSAPVLEVVEWAKRLPGAPTSVTMWRR